MTITEKQNIRFAWCSIIALAAGLHGCSSVKDHSATVAGQIRVTNGDFETGTVSPWIPWLKVQARVSPDNPRSGKFSLQEDSGEGSMYQDVTGLQPGSAYTISAWVFAGAGEKTSAQIAAYDPAADVATFSPVVIPTHSWQIVKHQIQAGSQGKVRIHLFHKEGPSSVYWDDVQIAASAQ